MCVPYLKHWFSSTDTHECADYRHTILVSQVYNDYHLKFLWVWLPLIPRCTHTTLFVKFGQWISIDWLVFYVNLNNISAKSWRCDFRKSVGFYSGFLPQSQLIVTICLYGFKKIHKWEAAMRLSSHRICHYVKTNFVLHWTYIYLQT